MERQWSALKWVYTQPRRRRGTWLAFLKGARITSRTAAKWSHMAGKCRHCGEDNPSAGPVLWECPGPPEATGRGSWQVKRDKAKLGQEVRDRLEPAASTGVLGKTGPEWEEARERERRKGSGSPR